jgi:thymidylate synthase
MQFLIRENKLHAIVTMRSNELMFNFRTDVHFFMTLHQMMAVALGIKPGAYHHNVGSMHIRADNMDFVRLGSNPEYVESERWPSICSSSEVQWMVKCLNSTSLRQCQNALIKEPLIKETQFEFSKKVIELLTT